VLVTTPALYRRKVASIRHLLPRLEHVILVGAGQHDLDGDVDGALGYEGMIADASERFTIPATDPEDMALLHFTSGTTGTPKGAIHVHDAVVAHHATGTSALDLHPGDVFWCTADPGWVTGMSYGIIAPLTHGVTCIVDEADFETERWYRILAEQKVSVWYTAPTALRMLMRAGPAAAQAHDLSHLRFVASVGEPLNPEVVEWGQEALGLPVHDNWWQTETGGIMIANLAGCDIRPGSMGRPLPGIEVAILARGADGRAAVRNGAVEAIEQPGVDGELALRPGWPSMFRGYLHDDARYVASFAGGWYLTGDVARRDGDGWLWFVGRADDVIKSAGHLIGPFEVESVLMEHPAVVEAGVIGVPDLVAGEVVKAFVTLVPGHEPSDDLRLELIGFARRRLGAAVAPREIAFDQHLPKTKSGKILRRLLKARELGLPEGDLSTLEVAS
jgi:acetyl-CoA synthetase